MRDRRFYSLSDELSHQKKSICHICLLRIGGLPQLVAFGPICNHYLSVDHSHSILLDLFSNQVRFSWKAKFRTLSFAVFYPPHSLTSSVSLLVALSLNECRCPPTSSLHPSGSLHSHTG